MRATFKLINSYFWKTFYGPIIAFIFPILLLSILGNIMKIQYVYPGIIATTILFIGVLALPLAIMELKTSSLFKYIGSSPVNPMKFSFVVIFYYTFISILTGFIIMFSTIIIFPNKVFHEDGFKNGILGGLLTIRGFFSFYIASFLHLILVIIFGLVIATFSKTPQQALTCSIVIIIPSMFLSGMIISVDIIAESNTMQWFSRFVPFRYTTGNIVVSLTPINQLGDLFQNITPDHKKIIFKKEFINKDNGQIWGYIKDDKIFYNLADRDNNNQIFSIKSFKELSKFVKEKENIINNFNTDFFNDKHLYNLIFLNKSSYYNSNNNIFDWTEPWVVRRIPSIEATKNFLQSFFEGKDGKGGTPARLINIWHENIKEGKFGFIQLFFTQSNILYTQVEKILNILLPLSLIGFGGFYINKNFSWSNR